MAVKYGGIDLQGPFSQLDQLEDTPGVFVLLCSYEETGHLELLLVNTATRVQAEVEAVLSEDWTQGCKGKLRVAVCYGAEGPRLDEIREEILLANA